MMNRREFLQMTLVTALAGSDSNAAPQRAPRILICSAWQVVNIGDIAHTPGLLALLETHFPEAEATLWPWKPLTPAAASLMTQRFPHLRIVSGDITMTGEASTPELAQAMDEADFFLHGSGPATIGWERAEAFQARTGRGFGIYGVTYGLYGMCERETLSRALRLLPRFGFAGGGQKRWREGADYRMVAGCRFCL